MVVPSPRTTAAGLVRHYYTHFHAAENKGLRIPTWHTWMTFCILGSFDALVVGHTHTHPVCHKKGESKRDADADTVAEPRAVDRAAECTSLPPKKWGAWLELRESFSRKCPKICSQAQPCWFGPSCIFPSARWGGIGRTCPCLQLLQARPPRPESRPLCIPVRWSRSVLRLVANLRIGVVFARAREMVAAGSKNFDAPSQQFCGRAKRFEEPPLMDELPASQQQQQQQQHRPELPSSLAAFGGLLSILGAACPPCFSHSHTPPRTNHLLTYTSGAAIVKTRPPRVRTFERQPIHTRLSTTAVSCLPSWGWQRSRRPVTPRNASAGVLAGWAVAWFSTCGS